ncbi:MAG: hypothetical protein EHM21_13025 [Chloroflexi bacterium]|nr:MAG: hypothetical protein EHM21_13025 [Chloroflexota bacterium]
MDTFSGPFTLERSPSGFTRVCGRSVYYPVDNQGAAELRSWTPGGGEEVLLRYHPLNDLPAGIYSQDENLPKYNLLDFQCGGGWLAIWTSEGQILAARDAHQ